VLFFAEKLTIPLIKEGQERSVLEIGSSYGNSIRPVLELDDVNVSIIDPCIDTDLLAAFGGRITLHKGLSLDILTGLEESYDYIFIDGDHNWYTVFNELRLIEQRNLLKAGGVIFLHDIGWPYGRRDMYYQPETIPAAHRNPHATRGIQRGQSALVKDGGFNAGHYNAIEEFGPRNGVLTAVEDYLQQSRQQYHFVKDFREFGLGILLDKSRQSNFRRASTLRFRIFRQSRVDPKVHALNRSIHGLRTSALANRARRIRDTFRSDRASGAHEYSSKT
jgi:SAM-dependent methyltransferase